MRDALTPGPETRVPRRQARPSSGMQREARAERSVPLFGGARQRGTEAPVFLRLQKRFRSQRLRLHLPLRLHLRHVAELLAQLLHRVPVRLQNATMRVPLCRWQPESMRGARWRTHL